MTEGLPVFEIGPLRATYEGLNKGLEMSWRLVLLIMLSSLLTLTTSPIQLADGIEGLLAVGKPIGIPAHELAMMMTIALRFIPTLFDETVRIIKAQTARGVDFESGGFVARLKGLVPILVPLFLSAFRRADELAIAMEARCYRGGRGRTRMKRLEMSIRDYSAIVISGCVIIVVAVVL
jgi:energy-coupling factor transport system permease protein